MIICLHAWLRLHKSTLSNGFVICTKEDHRETACACSQCNSQVLKGSPNIIVFVYIYVLSYLSTLRTLTLLTKVKLCFVKDVSTSAKCAHTRLSLNSVIWLCTRDMDSLLISLPFIAPDGLFCIVIYYCSSRSICPTTMHHIHSHIV